MSKLARDVINTRIGERLGENIYKLITRLHKFCNNISGEYLFSNKGTINLKMLSQYSHEIWNLMQYEGPVSYHT